MHLRIAAISDAPALTAIYAPYVENTAITFEYTVPTAAEFAERIKSTLSRYPYFVAVEDGRITGYAYASAFKLRAAYDWSAETSVYIARGLHGQGIGRLLYTALEDALTKQHVCNACACISYPNPESIAFHNAFGYKTVAHFSSSGYKLDSWHDIVWMEKTLCPHTIPPKPFIPFSQLAASYVFPVSHDSNNACFSMEEYL